MPGLRMALATIAVTLLIVACFRADDDSPGKESVQSLPAERVTFYGADEGDALSALAIGDFNDDNTLDLRGLSLSVALERTEAFCDLCVVKYVSPVVLIHGHGTGKLKAGIRGWLKDNPYVAGFRPGGSGEGRDGVTVVALNL